MSESRRNHPRANAIRIGLGGLAACFVVIAAVFGIVIGSVAAFLVVIALAGASLGVAALLLQDGKSLPRMRPLESVERRVIVGLLVVGGISGGAAVLYLAAGAQRGGVLVALTTCASAAAISVGVYAVIVMLRT